MDKFFKIVANVLDKIPLHIRDLIQKAAMAIAAFLVLLALIYGIRRGLEDAIPGGVQLYETTEELFYIQRLRHENLKREQLIEDVETIMPQTGQLDERIHSDFQQLGRETKNRLMGESPDMLKESTPFDPKNPARYLDETKEPQPMMPGLDGSPSGSSSREALQDKTLPLLDDDKVLDITPAEASPATQTQSPDLMHQPGPAQQLPASPASSPPAGQPSQAPGGDSNSPETEGAIPFMELDE